MKSGFLTAIINLTLLSVPFCQAPASSIYLLNVVNTSDSIWTISRIEYLNSFNPKAYNNQVYFLSPSLLLASIRLSQSNNNEIYQFDLNAKTYKNITQSLASEYSPRKSPKNSKSINCIRVSPGETEIQTLVSLDLQTGEYQSTELFETPKIAYYRYFRDNQWVCYLLKEPHVLAICDAKTNRTKIFASAIGRTFEVLNDDEILFIHKITPDKWYLKIYQASSEKSKIIAEMPNGTEDFAIDESGNIYCANDSKIFKLTASGIWHAVVDLKPLGISQLNRLTISGKRIAVVSLTNL